MGTFSDSLRDFGYNDFRYDSYRIVDPILVLGIGGFLLGCVIYHKYSPSIDSPVTPSSLETQLLQDEDHDGRFELPSSLRKDKDYTLFFDDKGNPCLK